MRILLSSSSSILLELAAHQHANEVKGHNLGKHIAFISLIFIQVVEGQLAMAEKEKSGVKWRLSWYTQLLMIVPIESYT